MRLGCQTPRGQQIDEPDATNELGGVRNFPRPRWGLRRHSGTLWVVATESLRLFDRFRLARWLLYPGIVVTPLRMKLAALSLVTVIIAMTGGSVFAQAVHPVCIAKQHDCGKTAKILKCCCGDQDASRTDSAPVQPRVDVRAEMTAMPALPNIVSVVPAPQALHPVQTSRQRLCLLDLPTLFVTFLI